MGRVKVRSEFIGKGALIQAAAIAVGFLGAAFPIPFSYALFLLAAVMFFYGSGQGQFYVCSECGNKLDHRKIKVCPTCKSNLG